MRARDRRIAAAAASVVHGPQRPVDRAEWSVELARLRARQAALAIIAAGIPPGPERPEGVCRHG
jgi:hypothetical protein